MTISSLTSPLVGLISASGAGQAGETSGSRASTSSSAVDSAEEARGSDKAKTPGQDVTDKLKAFSEELLAIMLITDPVKRAEAVSGLYKKYAQTADDYANATADGRAAANAASAPAEATDGASAVEGGAEAAATPPPQPAPATLPPAIALVPGQGDRPGFAADLFMEQIKMFAKTAHDVYDQAVMEARLKGDDDTKAQGRERRMKDAEEQLTKAAKAVEGSAATADGYDPVGASMARSAPPVVTLSA